MNIIKTILKSLLIVNVILFALYSSNYNDIHYQISIISIHISLSLLLLLQSRDEYANGKKFNAFFSCIIAAIVFGFAVFIFFSRIYGK